MTENDFYLSAALYAMQGMQEMGGNLGEIAELFPKEVAKRSFAFADAMVEEARKRKVFEKDNHNTDESQEEYDPVPLSREQIADILREMKVVEGGNEQPVKFFSFIILNPDYDPENFSQEIEDSEKDVVLPQRHSEKWNKNHTKKCKAKLMPMQFTAQCVHHKDGTRDYCSNEIINNILSVGNVISIV